VKSRSRIIRSLVCLAAVLLMVRPFDAPAEDAGETTYDITLIQTAEPDSGQGGEQEIREVAGRKVLTEIHSVEDGEWIWQILRERKLLEKRNLVEILDILRQLNPELTDLNRIHPGQKILVPLTLAPAQGVPIASSPPETVPVVLEDLEGLDLDGYTVRPGDSLVKIIHERYEDPDGRFLDRYLNAVRRLNPAIQDLNVIRPGQLIRLPVFSPEMVRMRIPEPQEGMKKPHPDEDMPEMALEPPPDAAVQIGPTSENPNPLRDDIGRLVSLLGEGWIQRGQHYIPLKGQGEVKLRADTYPMIDLSSGLKVIVDLHHSLPGDMATLIEKTWDHYRIVHLEKGDGLREALDRILPECNLGTLLGRGEVFHLGGNLQVKLTADWILHRPETAENRAAVLMITLLDKRTPPTPEPIRAYLARQGVNVVDFPPPREPIPGFPQPLPELNPGPGLNGLVEMLLDLNRLDFMRNVELPIYEKEQGADFNLFVKADYLLEKDGEKFLLDLTGVGSDVIALLRERNLSYLSLAGETSAIQAASRILEFLSIPFEPAPLDLAAAQRDGYQNIRIRVPGVVFRDSAGRLILATGLDLPEEIRGLLASQGYRVLRLASL